jgi:cellulose synthase/poly-beta-1,6-N-acetylglucosamine synthase-like glycosyltransferase
MVFLTLPFRKRQAAQDRNILEQNAITATSAVKVTTQLPIYNEKNVVARLLAAVCAFDYPQDRHEIQVLDDSTDETSALVAELVQELQLLGHDIHHIRREHRKGFKAGALAEGLKVAKGEFVAIFDADFVPAADFLKQTVPFLLADDRCCFVQTRWGHRNRTFSLLTELQSIGIDGHFVVEQAARAWHGLFFNFNGTAGIWRIAAINDAGGWKADTLTEDLDLSYRSLLRGWHPRYLWNYVTPAEVPTDINALKAQQRRWATGSIQCALKILPTVLSRSDLGIFKRIQAALHLTHYLIHPLILILTLLILPLILLKGVAFANILTLPLVIVMLVALFGPSTLYVISQVVTGGNWRRTLLLMPLLVGIGIGLAVNNSMAVASALLGLKGGEFVRTPKLGSLAEDKSAARAQAPSSGNGGYRQPLNGIVIFELIMGVWALGAFMTFTNTLGTGGGFMLLVQALGFSAVGILSIMHDRRHHKWDPTHNTS